MDKVKTIFLGTPEFSVPALEALINDPRFDIELVITQQDKKVGRKQIITPPPVKIKASENNIQILQPEKIIEAKEIIEKIKPDLAVVIAYGKIIPQEILDIPKFGFINIHVSLLPKYRGSSSCIQAPILNGDKETGVTIMQMDAGLDTGPIIKQTKISLEGKETAVDLHDKLMILGAKILPDTLVDFISGNIKSIKQDDEKATHVKMLKKEDGIIDWDKSAIEIERMIRALNPWPSTYTQVSNKSLKILEVENDILEVNDYKSGEIFLYDSKMAIQCGKDAIIIKKLQLEGKKPVLAKDFLRGNQNFIGKILK